MGGRGRCGRGVSRKNLQWSFARDFSVGLRAAGLTALRIYYVPRGSIYTSIMELGPKRPSLLWFWDPNSIIGVYMDPLGFKLKGSRVSSG